MGSAVVRWRRVAHQKGQVFERFTRVSPLPSDGMTDDDVRDPRRREADDGHDSTPRWNPESPFCTDERGSFFAHGHRVTVGRVYRDTETDGYRAVHSVDEESREALLYEVERDEEEEGGFAVVSGQSPLSVPWHEDGGRFVPV
jgi:hypothetical protein